MPYPAMPTVECLRVHAVELPHGFGKIRVRGFEQQMEVVRHQAIAMTNHVEPAQRHPEHGKKGAPVAIIQKYGRLCIAPGSHMVDGSRKFYAEWSGHEAEILRDNSRIKI